MKHNVKDCPSRIDCPPDANGMICHECVVPAQDVNECQIERETIRTVVGILLLNQGGAAMNAVSEDYPEFAAIIKPFTSDYTAKCAELERVRLELETLKNQK